MTRPTLTVVGGKGPETHEEDAEMIARAAGDDVSVSFFGGKLESSVLAEELAGEMKREAVGL